MTALRAIFTIGLAAVWLDQKRHLGSSFQKMRS